MKKRFPKPTYSEVFELSGALKTIQAHHELLCFENLKPLDRHNEFTYALESYIRNALLLVVGGVRRVVTAVKESQSYPPGKSNESSNSLEPPHALSYTRLPLNSFEEFSQVL